MSDLHDEDLILFYYGEAANAQRIQQQLESSEPLRVRYEELCDSLDLVSTAPLPEPGEDYGSHVWRRLEPQLTETSPSLADRLVAWLRPAWLRTAWLPATVMRPAFVTALLVVLAFAAGRWLHDEPLASSTQSTSTQAMTAQQGRERLLRRSVGQHLEQNGRLLTELSNLPASAMAEEASRAGHLLATNRIYRSTARDSGLTSVTVLLEELERLLLDLAHTSPDSDLEDLESIQHRVEGSALLFRVQILSSQLQETLNKNPSPAAAGDSSGAEI